MFKGIWDSIKSIFTGPSLKEQYEQMVVEEATKSLDPQVTIQTTEVISDVKVSGEGEVLILTEEVVEDVVVAAAPVVNNQITDAVTAKPKRAKSAKGKFVADDKSTPDVNEAWVGGKAPAKKSRKKKK